MDIVEIVFSPTGGTQKAAEGLIQTWGAPSRRIDLTAPSLDMDALTVLADEVAVIAVPSFGGRVPALAAHGVAEYVLPAPIPRERAMEVALEQYGYCADIVDQSFETVGALADGLPRATVWYFWWD